MFFKQYEIGQLITLLSPQDFYIKLVAEDIFLILPCTNVNEEIISILTSYFTLFTAIPWCAFTFEVIPLIDAQPTIIARSWGTRHILG